METQIKQVNDYFVNKLLDKDFELIEVETYWAIVKIDDVYEFTLWIGNASQNFSCYEYKLNFMHLDFDEVQKQYLHKYFNDLRKELQKDILLKEIEERRNKLKNL